MKAAFVQPPAPALRFGTPRAIRRMTRLLTAELLLTDTLTMYLRMEQRVPHSLLVDWGDGSVPETFDVGASPGKIVDPLEAPHTWPAAGRYTLTISSQDPDCICSFGWTPYYMTGSHADRHPAWRSCGRSGVGYYNFLGDETGMNSPVTGLEVDGSEAMVNFYSFYNCTRLEEVTLKKIAGPEGRYSQRVNIQSGAFQKTAIRSFLFPEESLWVRDHVFHDCAELRSITFYNTLKGVDYYAFEGCTSLTDVYYHGTPEQWAAVQISDEGNGPLLAAAVHYIE